MEEIKYDIEYTEIALKDVLRYFAKDFDGYVNHEAFTDTSKNIVVFKLTTDRTKKTHSIKLDTDSLIEKAGLNLRSVSWHSDGRIIAKSSAGAKNPRKLYTGQSLELALSKLIEDNKS